MVSCQWESIYDRTYSAKLLSVAIKGAKTSSLSSFLIMIEDMMRFENLAVIFYACIPHERHNIVRTSCHFEINSDLEVKTLPVALQWSPLSTFKDASK